MRLGAPTRSRRAHRVHHTCACLPACLLTGTIINVLRVLFASCAGIASGSGKPNEDKVGKVTKAQVEEIAKRKLPDTNTTKLDSACRMVEGTARSLGLVVVD